MQAHRTETTVLEDGVLTLNDVPFRKGDTVEVIVMPAAEKARSEYPLRGKPISLKDPTAPSADDEWEAAR